MPFLGTTGGGSVKQYGGQANLGYFIKNSLRLRGSASAYLSKTYGTSPTSRTTITHSFWLKIGALSNAYNILALFGTFDNYEQISLVSPNNTNGWIGNSLRIAGPGGSEHIRTTQVFRDPAAWYHIVVVYDTTNATATDRVRLYVNGSRVTAFAASANPTQNQQTTQWLVSGAESDIGKTGNSSIQTFDGYMAEINVIDGQALDPSSFGKTDAVTGQWIPKKFASTYGTNGFYLKFADASAATAAAIGKDSSPNGNNWTPNNISVTAGATYDAMIDSPSLSAVASNYCTWNPLAKGTNLVTTNGNLSVNNGSTEGSHRAIVGTLGMTTGKWYWEALVNNSSNVDIIGVVPSVVSTFNSYVGALTDSAGWGYGTSTGAYYAGGNWSSSGTAPAFTSSATIMIAYDADAKKLWFGQNGTWNTAAGGVGNPGAGTNAIFTYAGTETTFLPAVSIYNNTGAWVVNFGQRAFSYTAPTGFKSLNTFNLP
jgi:hypothetical protein